MDDYNLKHRHGLKPKREYKCTTYISHDNIVHNYIYSRNTLKRPYAMGLVDPSCSTRSMHDFSPTLSSPSASGAENVKRFPSSL